MTKVQLAKVQVNSKSHSSSKHPARWFPNCTLLQCPGVSFNICREKYLIIPNVCNLYAPDHPRFGTYSAPVNQHLSQGRGFAQRDDYSTAGWSFKPFFCLVQLQTRDFAAYITAKAAGQVHMKFNQGAGLCTGKRQPWLNRLGNEMLESSTVERDLLSWLWISSIFAAKKANHVLGCIRNSISSQAWNGVGVV